MGYIIKKLPYKSRSWKVQYQDRTNGQDAWRDIPEGEYSRLGFHASMSIEEAKERRDALNANEELKRLQEKRNRINLRLHKDSLILKTKLGVLDVEEFESDFASQSLGKSKKFTTLWKTSQEVLVAVGVELDEWEDKKKLFYKYFIEKQWSFSYCKKVIPMLNLWGRFLARKRRSAWFPLPYPTSYEKEAIQDAFLEKGKTKESSPLTPEALEKTKGAFSAEHYNWLYISLWFGLRAPEVDSLHSSKYYRIETHHKIPVLFVYQSKLKGIAQEKRWKNIPCIEPEQKEAIKLVQKGVFKRPLVKTIKLHLDGGMNTHAGRKGFTDLMLERGHAFEKISSWLGHQSIDMTWRKYKDKQRVVI